jgi:hypothetical protein
MWAYPLVDLRGITLYPSPHRRMIDAEATLAHHLLKVPVGELIPAIPADAQKDDGRLEVSPFERGLMLIQQYDSKRMLNELTGEL